MGLFYLSEEPVESRAAESEQLVLLAAGGELDHHASPRLRACIADHIDAGRRRVVLDLSRVSFIDSTAIGVLVGAAARLQDTGGGSVAAICPDGNDRVLRIFDIAGVDSVISLYPSRADALSALARAG